MLKFDEMMIHTEIEFLTYFVPFVYDCGNDSSYESIVKEIESHKEWTIPKIPRLLKNPYMCKDENSFFDCESIYDSQKSSQWTLKSEDNKGLVKLLFIPSSSEIKKVDNSTGEYTLDNICELTIDKVNIKIYDNGIGLLSYSIDVKHVFKEYEYDDLEEMCDVLRTLSNSPHGTLWERKRIPNEIENDLTRNDCVILSKNPTDALDNQLRKFFSVNTKIDNHIESIEPFYLAKWIRDIIPIKKFLFLSSQNQDYERLHDSYIEVTHEVDLGDMPNGFFNLNYQIELSNLKGLKVPQKAEVFASVALDNLMSGKENINEFSYIVGNMFFGIYNDSVEYIGLSDEMALQYNSNGVVFYRIKGDDEGKGFVFRERNTRFKSIRAKWEAVEDVKESGFFSTFVHASYLTYSLMYYSQKLDKMLDDLGDESQDVSKILVNNIRSLQLFLTKCIYAPISFDRNLNSFYKGLLEYNDNGKIITSIKEKVTTVTNVSTLIAEEKQKEAALDQRKAEMLQKERDENMQFGLGLVAILAVFSAVNDMIDVVAKFSVKVEENPTPSFTWFNKIWSERIAVLFLIAIFVAMVFAVRSLMVNKKEDFISWCKKLKDKFVNIFVNIIDRNK